MSFGGKDAHFHRAFGLARLLPLAFKHSGREQYKDEKAAKTGSFTQVRCAE